MFLGQTTLRCHPHMHVKTVDKTEIHTYIYVCIYVIYIYNLEKGVLILSSHKVTYKIVAVLGE